jgi:photosystem II stability/assembly factor-like uncharacterized protein
MFSNPTTSLRITTFLVLAYRLMMTSVMAQEQAVQEIRSFNTVPGIYIRALEVLNDSCVWFAANRGVWGYTMDGGKNWRIDSIKVDTIYPAFRSMALLNDSTALLLCIGSPAYMLKTQNSGKTWRTVYRNDDKDVFFDCMLFSGSRKGLAIGDPLDGCFHLIETTDGGETWRQINCSLLPKAHAGEACFAASNSNLSVRGDHTWFVSGGKNARVFYSAGPGLPFKAFETPLPKGETMSGIFSLDFFDQKKGLISGGHYEKTDTSIISLATTNDGGATWRAIRPEPPFFGSCVRFRNSDEVFVTGHDGTFSIHLPSGKITELKDSSGVSLKFYTLRFSPSAKFLWLAGSAGKITRINLDVAR